MSFHSKDNFYMSNLDTWKYIISLLKEDNSHIELLLKINLNISLEYQLVYIIKDITQEISNDLYGTTKMALIHLPTVKQLLTVLKIPSWSHLDGLLGLFLDPF